MAFLNTTKKYHSREDTGFQEMSSVPYAQIAATIIQKGNIDSKSVEVFEEVLPIEDWKSGYRFSFSDPIKFNASFNRDYLNEHKLEFLAAWSRTLRKNLPIYVQSYMYHTYGFWNVSPFNQTATDYTQSFFTKINNNTGEDSYWGKFLNKINLKNISGFSEPVYKCMDFILKGAFCVSLSFSPGMMIWSVFACLAMLIMKKKYKSCMIALPTVLVWITLMLASPSSLIYRYSFYLVLNLPVILSMTVLNLYRDMDIKSVAEQTQDMLEDNGGK